MDVTVDLHDMNMPLLPEIRPDSPLFATNIFAAQEEGAEPLITEVIEDNLSSSFIEDNEGEEG